MKTIFVVGHKNPDTDSIACAIAYATLLRMLHPHETIIAARAGSISDETNFVLKRFKIKPPALIRDGTKKVLVLVDHNEYSQAIKDIHEAKIIEVIDHHRISGDIKTIAPIPFESDVRGSTSTIIYERFMLYNRQMSREVAGLLLSGILSDTLLLKSPTTTKRDREAVKHLSRVVGVDYREYGAEMLEAGCNIIRHSPKKIITSDLKEFRDKKLVAIGQVPVINLKDISHIKHKLLIEMEELAKKRGYYVFALMITNIVSNNTELLFVGDKSVIERAFKTKISGHSLLLKKVVSRKKQVQPYIINAIK